jgi:hypothetical protein
MFGANFKCTSAPAASQEAEKTIPRGRSAPAFAQVQDPSKDALRVVLGVPAADVKAIDPEIHRGPDCRSRAAPCYRRQDGHLWKCRVRGGPAPPGDSLTNPAEAPPRSHSVSPIPPAYSATPRCADVPSLFPAAWRSRRSCRARPSIRRPDTPAGLGNAAPKP